MHCCVGLLHKAHDRPDKTQERVYRSCQCSTLSTKQYVAYNFFRNAPIRQRSDRTVVSGNELDEPAIIEGFGAFETYPFEELICSFSPQRKHLIEYCALMTSSSPLRCERKYFANSVIRLLYFIVH